jgi:phosphopantothenoylcysteine decarboxylase/phosphopantothenate--cysteine ligase
MLGVNDYTIIEHQEKLLACVDIGSGALAEPSEIFFETAKVLLEEEFWKDRRIVVTGGGTREKIDEVRYISNFSSGKMAKSLCLALYLKGADVCYLTTMGNEGLPQSLYTIDVENAEEMLDYTKDAIRVSKKGKMSKPSMNASDRHLIQKEPFLFMVAAVSDFSPKFPQDGKLKKSMIGETWSIELEQTPDILSSLDKSNIKTVAFKAEMDAENGLAEAEALLVKKQVDAVGYNLLKNAESFGSDDNEITFITKDKKTDLGSADKLTLSERILQEAKALTNA